MNVPAAIVAIAVSVHLVRVRDRDSLFALWTSLRRALPLAHRAHSLSDVRQVVPPLDGMKATPWRAVQRAAWAAVMSNRAVQ